MKKVYSANHPQIEAGVGITADEALINFVKNADAAKVEVREAWTRALGQDLESYLQSNPSSKALRKLKESGSYGPLTVEH